MFLAGIDYSLTCPAITIWQKREGILNPLDCHFFFNILKPTKKLQELWKSVEHFTIFPTIQNLPIDISEISRYDYLSQWAIDILKKYDVKKVYIEGYSFASTGRVFNIAEATGILKYKMTKENIEIEIVPPTVHKKIFCGKGNATKDIMIEHFRKQYPDFKEFEYYTDKNNPSSDLVDSFSVLYSGNN